MGSLARRFANGAGIGIGGRYLAEQFIAEDNAFELDSTLTLNAALFYELKDWSLGLHFDNLTDEEYRIYNLDLGLLGFIEQIFAPPRQVGVTATLYWQ